MKHAARLILLSLAITGLMAAAAQAEGTYNPAASSPLGYATANSTSGDEAISGASAARPAARHRKPAKKPVMPAAPIPYTVYKNGKAPAASPKIAAALTPDTGKSALAPLPPPVAIHSAPLPAQPPLPVQAIGAAPPPAPEAAPPVASAPAEISLRCETRVTQGRRLISQGSFYINIFPSPVFPDQQADFKFLFADPGHRSLIRQSICLDTTCSAEVSGTAYYLVNRRTRHGDALRITLDRANGAFYAEQIDKNLGGGEHLGEQGICTPQKLPSAIF
ncbi:hypothetical protein [Asticcacaulis sp. EMRT-3]|uniref:hypothetical protein n=1 Tax=Asticcacaulis sp. EMRT-3 TaxID=3040349 RepID=UPI0024AEF93E|nr:hypothetical protein [Asticcacaulis sp. EMRT-3]MDI7775531.1 hypothetical protein [Asticcacaulis sp. EMRT-3]